VSVKQACALAALPALRTHAALPTLRSACQAAARLKTRSLSEHAGGQRAVPAPRSRTRCEPFCVRGALLSPRAAAETMRNNLDPVFTTAIVVDYFFEEVRASRAVAHANAPGPGKALARVHAHLLRICAAARCADSADACCAAPQVQYMKFEARAAPQHCGCCVAVQCASLRLR
jgi:hypothetical protein